MNSPFAGTYQQEWYTPPEIAGLARSLMGSIDLDPASCTVANRYVKASAFHTQESDGLFHEWSGNVFLNPPGDKTGKLARAFVGKLFGSKKVTRAFYLAFNISQLRTCQDLIPDDALVCIPRKRIAYIDQDGNRSASPDRDSAIVYRGSKYAPHQPDLELLSRVGICLGVERAYQQQSAQGEMFDGR